MKALVTGNRGFIGRHISGALEKDGYAVMGVDRDCMGGALEFFRHCNGEFDLVVHAAAVVGGRATIEGSPLDLGINFELDAALFAWALRARPGRIVYLSSSAAYPVAYQRIIARDHAGAASLREGDINTGQPMAPDALYGWCKLTGEILASYAREAGVPVSVVRPFSGYGEDQSEDYPFPAIVGRARKREDPFILWGTGEQVRDFIHVDDVVAAILAIVRCGIDAAVNIGTGRPTSMIQLARMACGQVGYSPEIQPVTSAPAGVAYRVADTTFLRTIYTPKISLEEGVARALSRA